MSKPFFVKLPNRGLIHIEGEDRSDFLQGLITNDIEQLKTQPAIYACLLSPQGKFLHDFFVIKGHDFILLDCEGRERAQDLYTRLNKYRLRSKVTISVEEHNDVYALLSLSPPIPLPQGRGKAHNERGYPDTRHPDMGWRSFEKPDSMEEKPFDEWDKRRIRLCIPDGSRDMVPEFSTMLECNIDKLNGVCFEKGCYVGQELTARMHHRGLTKKHLYALEFDGPVPEPMTDTHINGTLIGQMRSSCENMGLAQIKDSILEGGLVLEGFSLIN